MTLASLAHQKVPSWLYCSLELQDIKLALKSDGITFVSNVRQNQSTIY